MTGHLLGAAGAIEAIACIKAIQHDIAPPTINSSAVEPGIKEKFNLTIQEAQKRPIQYAMSNTFGFGGHIATTIFKKYEPSSSINHT
jgi:3-oxoacyl-[acyl-carrier-protein] synthase II